MKYLTIALLLISSSISSAEVVMTTSKLTLALPQAAASCFSVNEANKTGTAPVEDIAGAHFRLSNVYIANNSEDPVSLSALRITIQTLNGPYICAIAGDQFAALGFPVEIAPGREAKNNCAIICGGVSGSDPETSRDAELEVFGLSRDATGNDAPVRMSAPFQVIVL